MRAANPELVAYAFLNRADPRGQDNEDAAAALQDTAELRFLDTPLGARKAFSNAAAQGMAVTELKSLDPKATDEVMMLYGYSPWRSPEGLNQPSSRRLPLSMSMR